MHADRYTVTITFVFAAEVQLRGVDPRPEQAQPDRGNPDVGDLAELSWKTVPLTANDTRVGVTGYFYKRNQVLDGNAFYFRAILADGKASW